MSSAAPDQAANPAGAPPAPPAQPQVAAPPPAFPANNPDYMAAGLNNLEPAALLKILRSLPGVFNQMEASNPATKQDAEQAAQALSNMAQSPFASQPGLSVQYPASAVPGMNDPGPSSHPRGPPNLGQHGAVAMQGAPPSGQPQADGAKSIVPQSPNGQDNANASTSTGGGSQPGTPAASAGGRRGRNPAIGSDEWTRQRKDNHKEVERRRRGNINEGINELGRIVPNGTGEKAKGAILARAVQYIHHLKENEARNIEKWTLEKLLMDQAMGDLQAQLEDIKRVWEEERAARTRLERELELLRGAQGAPKDEVASGKRRSEGDEANAEAEADRDGKRQRTE